MAAVRVGSTLAVLALSVLSACAVSDDDLDVGEQLGAWDAQSATNETQSTHLWIVNRALDILGRHAEDATASQALTFLNEPSCRTNWEQGLLDADFKAEYNNGRRDLPVPASNARIVFAGTTWESHFFDPDTRKNYEGAESPTAFTETSSHAENARRQGLASAEGCYELGLALHYYTDLTQPMHAANFTFKNRPVGLHSNLESYAVDIQDRYVLEDWNSDSASDIDDWVMRTAQASKALHTSTMQSVVVAYHDARARHVFGCLEIDGAFYQRQYIDLPRCWKNHPAVDASVGNSLKEAQSKTAQYIYLFVQTLVPAAD